MPIDAPATFTDVTEHVRVRAYFLYLQRGGLSHDPLEDWLQAEREVATRGSSSVLPG